MLIYGYDSETKEYLGNMEANEDPLETLRAGYSVYAIPANFTKLEPPEFDCFTHWPVFVDGKWKLLENHKGLVGFDKETGDEMIIRELGELPENFVLEKPIKMSELRDEKVHEIKVEASKAKALQIEYKGIKWTAESWVELSQKLKGTEDFAVIPLTLGDDEITILRSDLEEAVKYFYIRSMLISKKRKDLISEVLKINDIDTLKSFKVDFDIDAQVLDLVDKTIDELNEMFIGEN